MREVYEEHGMGAYFPPEVLRTIYSAGTLSPTQLSTSKYYKGYSRGIYRGEIKLKPRDMTKFTKISKRFPNIDVRLDIKKLTKKIQDSIGKISGRHNLRIVLEGVHKDDYEKIFDLLWNTNRGLIFEWGNNILGVDKRVPGWVTGAADLTEKAVNDMGRYAQDIPNLFSIKEIDSYYSTRREESLSFYPIPSNKVVFNGGEKVYPNLEILYLRSMPPNSFFLRNGKNISKVYMPLEFYPKAKRIAGLKDTISVVNLETEIWFVRNRTESLLKVLESEISNRNKKVILEEFIPELETKIGQLISYSETHIREKEKLDQIKTLLKFLESDYDLSMTEKIKQDIDDYTKIVANPEDIKAFQTRFRDTVLKHDLDDLNDDIMSGKQNFESRGLVREISLL